MTMYLSEKERADIASGKYPEAGEKVQCNYAKKCKLKCERKKVHKFNYEFCVHLQLPSKPGCPKDAKCEPIIPKFRRPSYRQIRQQTWAIKVMPDFSSSGIWYFNPPERGDSMANYEDLKITKELADEFEQWIRYYDTCFKSDYSTFKNKKMADKMNKWGISLAKKLKKELPEKEIWYWAETSSPNSIKKTKI